MSANCLSRLGRLIRHFRQASEGHVTVIFTLVSVVVVAAAGGAVDMIRFNVAKTALQAALDSAVLAAAEGGGVGWQKSASAIFARNASRVGGLAVTPAFALKNGSYEGSLSVALPTTVMSITGLKSLTVKAYAKAVKVDDPLCILALNAFDSGAFDMNGTARLSAPACAVQANTRSARGMTQEGSPSAVAAAFRVNGNYTGTSYSKQPFAGAAVVADPYRAMSFPAYATCHANAKALVINGGTAVLAPGTYCGGIDIRSQAQVTLQPGIYVMVNGPFLVNGGSDVKGSEVMIAFTGQDATLRLWGGSKLELTSPLSGPYANFQFFEDGSAGNSGRGAWVSIGGNDKDDSKAKWDGVAYFPTQNVWLYGDAQADVNSPGMAIVAGQIWLQGNARLNVTSTNGRQLAGKSVLAPGGARLVE